MLSLDSFRWSWSDLSPPLDAAPTSMVEPSSWERLAEAAATETEDSEVVDFSVLVGDEGVREDEGGDAGGALLLGLVSFRDNEAELLC